jgi:hypothetical protein
MICRNILIHKKQSSQISIPFTDATLYKLNAMKSLIVCLLVATCCGGCTEKYLVNTKISGKLMDAETGLPIRNMPVVLQAEYSSSVLGDTKGIQTAITNENGQYTFAFDGGRISSIYTNYIISSSLETGYDRIDTAMVRAAVDNKTIDLGNHALNHLSWVEVVFKHKITPVLVTDRVDFTAKESETGASVGIASVAFDGSTFSFSVVADKKVYLVKSLTKNGITTTTIDSGSFAWGQKHSLQVEF